MNSNTTVNITRKEYALYATGWFCGRVFDSIHFLLSNALRWIPHFLIGCIRLISSWFALFMRSPFIAIVILALGIASAIQLLNHVGVKI